MASRTNIHTQRDPLTRENGSTHNFLSIHYGGAFGPAAAAAGQVFHGFYT